LENIQLIFTHLPRGFELDRKRSQTLQIEPTFPEVFDCFTPSKDRSLSCLQIRQWTTSPRVLEQMDWRPISQRFRLTALHF
jgi:hypothetical protein